MGASVEEVRARSLLAQHGRFVRHAKHGDIWHLPGGATLVCSPESGRVGALCPRAWKNTLADMRRKLRAAGIRFEGDDVAEEAEGEDEMAAAKTLEKDQKEQKALLNPKIAALGVHVTRSRRVTESAEATVDLRALAALLGLTDEVAQSVEVTLTDSDGNEIEGPILVRAQSVYAVETVPA